MAISYKRRVAPRAGAWIETGIERTVFWHDQSPPARGRGLKLNDAGICIEIHVAPRAGAWIETIFAFQKRCKRMSPPARGRGLKLHSANELRRVRGRPPRGGVD